MKVYPIILREFKKNDNTPRFIYDKRDFFDCPSATEKPRLGTTV